MSVVRNSRRWRVALWALAFCGLWVWLYAKGPLLEAQSSGGVVRLRLATIAPARSPWADALEDLKRRIERESGYRIKVTLYLNGRRGGEQEMLSALLRGQLQAAAVSNGALAQRVPAFHVLELPFLVRSPQEADYVIDEVIGPELERRAAVKGLVVGLWSENGWRSIATREAPVRVPADCVGLQVRSQQSAVNVAFWKALGARPVRIALDEVLGALETGLVDGFDQTPLYALAAGWSTHVHYFTLTRHIYQPAMVVYSRRFLDSLPEDLRRIVLGQRDVVTEASRKAVREANRAALEVLRAREVEVIEPSPEARAAFVTKTRGVYQALRTKIGAGVIDKVEHALETYRRRHTPQGDQTR